MSDLTAMAVQIGPSDALPTGVVAPAIANVSFALTGEPATTRPLRRAGLYRRSRGRGCAGAPRRNPLPRRVRPEVEQNHPEPLRREQGRLVDHAMADPALGDRDQPVAHR